MDTTRLEQRDAIDMHVHVHVSRTSEAVAEANRDRLAAAGRYFKAGRAGTDMAGIHAYYAERNMACAVFSVDTETVDGRPPVPAEEIAEFAAEHADVIIPFGSVDPWKGALALQRMRSLIEGYGVKGFKFHPGTQAFYPNDHRFYPLYELLQESGLPAAFHTGQTGIGAGMRGGGGIRLKYCNPIYLDDVAADFPDLTIIMAHPSVPWQDEGLSVALHKPNVYIDLSGWSPKYFEPKLVSYVKRMLSHKVLFGSDFPVIEPDRWISDFDKLDIDADVRQKVLRGNALQLLGGIGLTDPAAKA